MKITANLRQQQSSANWWDAYEYKCYNNSSIAGSSCARPIRACNCLLEVQQCIIMLNLEHVQEKREILPGLFFAARLTLSPIWICIEGPGCMEFMAGSGLQNVRTNNSFLDSGSQTLHQLSKGNEAKSLLWIWEQYLGKKFFLAVMQNDTSASAVLHSWNCSAAYHQISSTHFSWKWASL